MKPLKSSKGFTLIEVIVVVALIGIILAGVTAIVLTSTSIYSSGKNLSFARDDVVTVVQAMRNEIRYAGDCEIISQFPAVPDPQYRYFYLKDGQVCSYRDGVSKPLLSLSGEETQDYKMGLSITRKSSSLLELVLTVYKKEAVLYTSSTQVTLNNAAGSISGTTGACIEYRPFQG